MADPSPRADRLFKNYNPENYNKAAYRLAQKIEWGDTITPADIAPVSDMINRRFGNDITFLFHAVASANLSAIDALLASGADVTMTDKAKGSARDFVYVLSMPGGPLMDQDKINEMIRIYLKHGGDPNYRTGGGEDPLVAEVGLSGNLDGVRILLKAGADPWANVVSKEAREDNLMTNLTLRDSQFGFFDELIDSGYFDSLTQKQLEGFFSNIGSYAQRGDDISREIQRITMRILKRNPHYIENDPEWNTGRIFKDHWQDPEPGVIPWDVINSEAVK